LPEKREAIAKGFFAACQEGNANALLDLLAADIVVYGDGAGNKRPAAAEPLVGRERVTRAPIAWSKQADRYQLELRYRLVNGSLALSSTTAKRNAHLGRSLDVVDGVVSAVGSVPNSDKLARLARP
jgi:RNA polymerase sigma-70 factor (ECF subfamily)